MTTTCIMQIQGDLLISIALLSPWHRRDRHVLCSSAMDRALVLVREIRETSAISWTLFSSARL
ncbi:hypothetical protein PVAP13_8KG071551 [Panicum virgatum]|uniref:Uncharacterized protein n=1 Tax=Panicum virgatum TaxID=38727 RepID=A0A8T0PGM1_PANVG|nr:hypothetical protein PVAP13_8KG071551 [Panicum virgatum]